jgi:hypothetical protein
MRPTNANTPVAPGHLFEVLHEPADSRNGRSSRTQFGRNPACEQADSMVDEYSSTGADAGQK